MNSLQKVETTKDKKLYFKSKINILERKFKHEFSNEELSIWFNFIDELQDGMSLFDEICNLIYINCKFMPTLEEIETKEIVNYEVGDNHYKRSILEMAKRKLIRGEQDE